ncbi:LexA-binding, inner membrane-associated putative hydrolase [uncultured archaeon]|nr:LexA-binding, inner membrane-associated putative hydrolase [uncultured archaeon]
MDWKMHLAIGFLSAALLTLVLQFLGTLPGIELLPPALLVVAFYSLLPDIDIESSVSHRAIAAILLLLAAGSILCYAVLGQQAFLWIFAVSAAIVVASKFLRHRGIAHTLRFALLASAPLAVLNPVFFLYAFVAFFSHLAADFDVRL